MNRRRFFSKIAKNSIGFALGGAAIGSLEQKANASQLASGLDMFKDYMEKELGKIYDWEKNGHLIYYDVETNLFYTVPIEVQRVLDNNPPSKAQAKITEIYDKAIDDVGNKTLSGAGVILSCRVGGSKQICIHKREPVTITPEKKKEMRKKGEEVLAKYIGFMYEGFKLNYSIWEPKTSLHYALPKKQDGVTLGNYFDFDYPYPMCEVTYDKNGIGKIRSRSEIVVSSLENLRLGPLLEKEHVKIK